MRASLLLALVAGGLAACGGNDVLEPPAELVEFEPRIEVRRVCDQRVGDGSERLRLGLRPASDGTSIFAGAVDGTAASFGILDGELLWETETGLRLSAGPGVGNGLVVYGTSDGAIIALDAETGEIRWQQPVGSEVLASPVVGDDIIAFRTVDGGLNTMDPTDGDELWTILQSMPVLTLRGNSPPIIVNDLIVAGFDNGRVAAYDAENGIEEWQRALATPSGRTEIDRLVDVGVDLEVFGNNVYAANFQGSAAAYVLRTGSPLWTRALSSFTGLGVDAQHVYVTTDVSAVIALNRLDGRQEAWRQEALRMRDVTPAARHRETVVVGDFAGYVHWLDAEDGSFMARRRAGSTRITAKPLAIGPLLFVQTEDGMVVAFEIVDEPDSD